MTDTVKHPRSYEILHAVNGAVVIVDREDNAILGAYTKKMDALQAIARDWGFVISLVPGVAQSMGGGFEPPAVNIGGPISCDPNSGTSISMGGYGEQARAYRASLSPSGADQ